MYFVVIVLEMMRKIVVDSNIRKLTSLISYNHLYVLMVKNEVNQQRSRSCKLIIIKQSTHNFVIRSISTVFFASQNETFEFLKLSWTYLNFKEKNLMVYPVHQPIIKFKGFAAAVVYSVIINSWRES